jgi:DNA-binding winged helix-turn-helix (wHTH) protein
MLYNSAQNELRLLIVGDYLFDPKVGLLSGPTGAHHICSRMADLLCCLVEHSDEIVDRDKLISEVWQDDPHAPQSLNQCMARLRHYFGDSAKAANYIETVPNLGYRLVAPVYGCAQKPALVRPAVNTAQTGNFGSGIYRLFREFRERKVCRSMLIYTMVVWLVFQVTEVVAPALNLPEWVNGLVVTLGLLGFPVAATLSWIFNLTPAGLVRDTPRVSNLGSAPSRNKADLVLDYALISVALVICASLVSACIG